MKPIKVFTHTDLDGVGSGLIFQSMYGKGNVDVTYCDYHKVDELVSRFFAASKQDDYAMVFITDISVNEDTAEIIDITNYAEEGKVQLLDHHDTAKWLNKYNWAIVDPQHSTMPGHKSSGTSLVIDWYDHEGGYAIPDATREFAEIVRKYDTWEWNTIYNDEFPKQMNDLLYMIGREEFVNHILRMVESNRPFINLSESTITDFWFSDGQKLLIDQKQKEIKKYIEKKDKQMITEQTFYNNKEYIMGLVFAEQHISELGNELCKLHPEIDFVAMVEMGDKKISFRTIREDIHLGEMAKELGGGGHPKAAGAQFTQDKIIDFLGGLF